MKTYGLENFRIETNNLRLVRTYRWTETINCWDKKHLWAKDTDAGVKFIIGESYMGTKQRRHRARNVEMTCWVGGKTSIFFQLSLKRNHWVNW